MDHLDVVVLKEIRDPTEIMEEVVLSMDTGSDIGTIP